VVNFLSEGDIELYHLQEDIGENRNLVSALPELAESMRRLLQHWRESVGARLPEINPEYRA